MSILADAFTEDELEQVSGGSDKLRYLIGFGEVQQMGLQRQMERQSKLLETLSDAMHAIAQTSKSITDNLR